MQTSKNEANRTRAFLWVDDPSDDVGGGRRSNAFAQSYGGSGEAESGDGAREDGDRCGGDGPHSDTERENFFAAVSSRSVASWYLAEEVSVEEGALDET